MKVIKRQECEKLAEVVKELPDDVDTYAARVDAAADEKYKRGDDYVVYHTAQLSVVTDNADPEWYMIFWVTEV